VRQVSIKKVWDTIERMEILPEDFMVSVEDSQLCDALFGSLSKLSAKKTSAPEIIRIRVRDIQRVFSISRAVLRARHIQGVEWTQDGYCNIDVNKMKKLGISKTELAAGTEVFIGAKKAGQILNLKKYPTVEHHQSEHVLRCGRIWLYRKSYIEELAQQKGVKIVPMAVGQ